jgi:hypothetical protein
MIPAHSPRARLPSMLIILITMAICVFTASVHAADEASSSSGSGKVHPVDDAKTAGEEIGHGVKEGTKAVGHGTKKVTREIGHGFRDGAKAVGHGTKEVTREVGHGFRDGAKAVGHGTAKATKEVGQSIQGTSKGDGKKD